MSEDVDDQPGVRREHVGQLAAVLRWVDGQRRVIERKHAAAIALMNTLNEAVVQPGEAAVRETVRPVDEEQRRAAGQGSDRPVVRGDDPGRRGRGSERLQAMGSSCFPIAARSDR